MEPTGTGRWEEESPGLTFTEYVRGLTADPAGDAEHFAALLKALRPLLVYELRRSGLWDVAPRYLGVHNTGEEWTTEAVDELLADGYVYVFVDRQWGLRRRVRLRSDVGDLVARGVRNFLHDTRKRHDPLGYRIYELLHQAVGRLVATRRFEISEGDPRLRHDTLLASPQSGEYSLALSAALRPSVVDVVEHLLEDLVASWGRSELVDELTERLDQLPRDGVLAFRFGELVALMTEEVRSRWYTRQRNLGEDVGEDVGDDDVELVALAHIEDDVSRQSLQQLLECVANGIDRLSRSQKTRDYLGRLWLYLRGWAVEHPAPSERVPSDSRMSKVLGIPRNRIPRLRTTLGKQVIRCRSGLQPGQGVAVRKLAAPGTAARNARLQALAGQAADVDLDVGPPERPPGPGDVFLFTERPEDDPEWAVVGVDSVDGEESRRFLAVPMDDFYGVGSRDVTLPEEREAGVTRLRCGHGVWLDESAFSAERRSGRISEKAVALARQRYRATVDGPGDDLFREAGRPTAVEREAHEDPEYRIHMVELAAVRRELVERHDVTPVRILAATGRFRRIGGPPALLAALLAVALLAVAFLFFFVAAK